MAASVYGDVAPIQGIYTGYLYSTDYLYSLSKLAVTNLNNIQIYIMTMLVDTNYTGYLGFTLRYRLNWITGL